MYKIVKLNIKTGNLCNKIHRTMLNEFYQVTFCEKIYSFIELQQDFDDWLYYYNHQNLSGKNVL
ncbi:transposase [Francisella tularensis subsp. tularensis MA00-2987]|nr:transposase [Francisella tularensis subsp. tularensis MA00-2987]